MILADLAAASTVFVDANIFLFAATQDAVHGAACIAFLDRAETHGKIDSGYLDACSR